MAFDIISSTVRTGLTIDEVEFDVPGAPPATAYLLGHQPRRTQSLALAIHDERGDKASLLPELELLARRGFLCLSIDSPTTRLAARDRDPAQAFESQYAIATAALHLLHDDTENSRGRVALIGRGLGGEVAGSLAAAHNYVNVAVAVDSTLNRSDFVANADHALAAGMRQFHEPAALQHIVDQLRPHQLRSHLEATPATHWLLQLSDDDDRLTEADRSYLATQAPPTVRVDSHATRAELPSAASLRRRVAFVAQLCG